LRILKVEEEELVEFGVGFRGGVVGFEAVAGRIVVNEVIFEDRYNKVVGSIRHDVMNSASVVEIGSRIFIPENLKGKLNVRCRCRLRCMCSSGKLLRDWILRGGSCCELGLVLNSDKAALTVT